MIICPLMTDIDILCLPFFVEPLAGLNDSKASLHINLPAEDIHVEGE